MTRPVLFGWLNVFVNHLMPTFVRNGPSHPPSGFLHSLLYVLFAIACRSHTKRILCTCSKLMGLSLTCDGMFLVHIAWCASVNSGSAKLASITYGIGPKFVTTICWFEDRYCPNRRQVHLTMHARPGTGTCMRQGADVIMLMRHLFICQALYCLFCCLLALQVPIIRWALDIGTLDRVFWCFFLLWIHLSLTCMDMTPTRW